LCLVIFFIGLHRRVRVCAAARVCALPSHGGGLQYL
jgi:hypothetical protein